MKIFCFDTSVGRPIDQFGSRYLTQSRIARLADPAFISCMVLEREGVIGYHQATIPQLFMVVDGEGWVRGEDEPPQPIRPGQAAFWEAGEWHETTTDSGLTAIVIEIKAERFDPGEFMPLC